MYSKQTIKLCSYNNRKLRKDIFANKITFLNVICKTKERIIRRKEKNKTVIDVQCMGKTNFAKQNYFYAEEEETIEKL